MTRDRFQSFVTTCLVGAILLTWGAYAQAQAWDTNVISFTPPATCTTGEPITSCPVSSYRIQRSATASGVYATVGATTTNSFTHTGASAGLNCYRAIAISSTGESDPSVVIPASCRTNTKPIGPPNPPTNLTVSAPIAFNVVPNYQKFAFDRGARIGTVKLGAKCDESRTTGAGYYVVSRLSMVTPRPLPGSVVVARCS